LEPVHVWLKPVERDHRPAAHALLLDLAGTLLDRPPVLRHDAAGAPRVDPLGVSISHSRRFVAVVAGLAGPVGVDLEDRYPRDVTGLAHRWFTPTELAWMADQPEELEAFLHLWTGKEAVGKALGTGLRNAGLRRQLPLPAGGPVPAEPQLTLVHLPVRSDTVLAVVVPTGVRSVEVCEHHGAALRSTAVSRTSFPVVVRGN
jgi:phosphopantetheinyl transferase (holo-ACP synthase)